jgi:hypothetical protein
VAVIVEPVVVDLELLAGCDVRVTGAPAVDVGKEAVNGLQVRASVQWT